MSSSNKPYVTATCDAGCQKDFRFSKIKTRIAKGGIKKHYFACPHCHHVYVAYYASKETERLQKKMSALLKRSGEGSVEWMQELNQLKAEIKQSTTRARNLAEN